jgi:hypothetical protein
VTDRPLRLVYDGPVFSGKWTSASHVGARLGGAWEETVGRDGATLLETAVRYGSIPIRIATWRSSRWAPRDWGDLLDGADAIVLVADSQSPRDLANVERVELVSESFARTGREVPVVLQANKRDLDPDGAWSSWAPETGPRPLAARLLSIEEMTRTLSRWGGPAFPSVATQGIGVWEAFEAAATLAIARRSSLQLREP